MWRVRGGPKFTGHPTAAVAEVLSVSGEWLTSKSKRGTIVAMTTDSLRNVSERGLPHELNRVLVQQSDVDARLAAAKAVFQVDLGDDVR